jgi:hypothetical protein
MVRARIRGDASDAEDVVQEVFVIRAKPPFDLTARPSVVCTMARTRASTPAPPAATVAKSRKAAPAPTTARQPGGDRGCASPRRLSIDTSAGP